MDSVNVIVKGDFGPDTAVRRVIRNLATKTGLSIEPVGAWDSLSFKVLMARASKSSATSYQHLTEITATRLIDTKDKSWMTETKKLIMDQAHKWFSGGDVTVFNVGVGKDEGMKIAEDLAEMTGGSIFSNWQDKDLYSIRTIRNDAARFKPSDDFNKPCINAFVAPEGWTLFDIAALTRRIAMEHKSPNAGCDPYIIAPAQTNRDRDVITGIRKTETLLLVEDVNGAKTTSVLRVTRSNPPSISIQDSSEREACLITELARRMGADRAYNFNATESMQVDTSSFGAEPIPSLIADKAEILTASMLKNNAMIDLMDDQSKETVEIGVQEVIREIVESQPEPKVMSEITGERTALKLSRGHDVA